MRREDFIRTLGLGGIGLTMVACEKFDYSSYQNELNADRRDTNAKELQKVLSLGFPNNKMRIALIADTHNHYPMMSAAVDHINARGDIDFVIHCGDLTDWGLESEYKLAQDHLKEFNKPYLTVVGNHDHISQNSSSLFKSMFGPLNWSFDLLGRKFIFFDNNLGDTPDFNKPWLEAQLADAQNFDQAYLITHAPTFSFTFGNDPDTKQWMEDQIAHPALNLTLQGHEHYFYYNEDDKLLLTEYIKDRVYNILEITDNGYSFERVTY